tara:strand:- start:1396 stop:2256 length:861 start_codon:yes stop_codon:yes gene_type:complete
MAGETPQCEFRLKKRARTNPQLGGGLDFSLENPADGRFKDLDCVKRLLDDYPLRVFKVATSYCNYGYDYRKRTLFISSLPTFQPLPACPAHKCQWKRRGERHSRQVTEASQSEKNSFPPLLIDLLVDSWRNYRVASKYLLIDMFSGWGSIEKRVSEKQAAGQWLNVHVYSNDIVKRAHTDCNLDMLTWTPAEQLVFAVNKLWPDQMAEASGHAGGVVGWLADAGVTVLVHASTPCETYSLNGIGVHRHKGGVLPKSEAARSADRMNERLVSYLRDRVLGERREERR